MKTLKLPAAAAAVALGLGGFASGLFLHVSDASGYPAGAVVSYGANPVVAVGGSASDSTTTTLLTAPAGQDLVITDVVLSGYVDTNCAGHIPVTLSTSSGGTVAGVTVGAVQSNASSPYNVSQTPTLNLVSGLPVPAGDSLTMTTGAYSTTSCGTSITVAVYYTVSGYYAEP